MKKRGGWAGAVSCTIGIGVLLVLAVCMPFTAEADDPYWIGGDGNWSEADKWSDGVVPNGNGAVLDTYGTVDYDNTENNSVITGLIIEATLGNQMILNHSAGTLTISGDNSLVVNGVEDDSSEWGSTAGYSLSNGTLVKEGYEVKIGTTGAGHFIQEGGSFQFSGAMYLGDKSGSSGFYGMRGGEIIAGENGAGSIVLGEWGGSGSFAQSGGAVTVNDLTLARQNESEGYYRLDYYDAAYEPTLVVNGPVVVGAVGLGQFEQYGGTHTAGSLTVGGNGWEYDDENNIVGSIGGFGSYVLNEAVPIDNASSNLKVNTDLVIGDGGNGMVFHGNGRVSVGENLILGRQASTLYGSGEYNLQNGELLVQGNTYVGKDAGSYGEFNQAGGLHQVDGSLYVDAAVASKGVYNLSGGGLDVFEGTIVGDFGNAIFNQGPGTTPELPGIDDGEIRHLSGWLVLGQRSTGVGTYNLSGGYLEQREGVEIGASGTGYFNQTGGMLQNYGYLVLGTTSEGSGEYILSDGTLYSNREYVGLEGNGSFKQAGGVHKVYQNLMIGNDVYNTGGYGNYELSAGNLETGNTVVSEYGIGKFIQSGGAHNTDTLALGRQSGSDGEYEITGGSLIVNTLHVGEQGHGQYTQTGGNAKIAHDMTVAEGSSAALSGGRLEVDKLVNDGEFTVSEDGELMFNLMQGSGTFIGDLVNNTTVAPGNSPGKMTITGDYAQGSSGVLDIELGGSTQGVLYDFLFVSGTATLDGALNVSFWESYVPTEGAEFDILHADGGIVGNFDDLTLPTLTAGLYWKWEYELNDFRLLVAGTGGSAPVPEPSTIFLLTSGLIGLTGFRKKGRGRE